MTLSITTTCYYAQCHDLFIDILNIVVLSVVAPCQHHLYCTLLPRDMPSVAVQHTHSLSFMRKRSTAHE